MRENIIPAFLNETRWEKNASENGHQPLSYRVNLINNTWAINNTSTEDGDLGKRLFITGKNGLTTLHDVVSSNGVGIPSKQNINEDTIEKESGRKPANYVAPFQSMVYPSNKKDITKQTNRNILIQGIAQLQSEGKPVNPYQLRKLVGMNKGTISKHWIDLRQLYLFDAQEQDKAFERHIEIFALSIYKEDDYTYEYSEPDLSSYVPDKIDYPADLYFEEKEEAWSFEATQKLLQIIVEENLLLAA